MRWLLLLAAASAVRAAGDEIVAADKPVGCFASIKSAAKCAIGVVGDAIEQKALDNANRFAEKGLNWASSAAKSFTPARTPDDTSEAYVYLDVLENRVDGKLYAFMAYEGKDAWVQVRDPCDKPKTFRVDDVKRASADQVTAFNAAVKGCENFERYADQGAGKKDPETGRKWEPAALEYYFAFGRGLPEYGKDFVALGGGDGVYKKLLAAKKRIEDREKKARLADERKNGKYAGLRSFPMVDDKMVFVSNQDWLNGGGINWKAAHEEYKAQNPTLATEATVQTRPDDERKPVKKFDPDASYARDIHEPDTNRMTATSNYNEGDYLPQWYFVLENFDVKKPGDAAAARALLVVMCVEFAHTLKSPEMIAAMVELTDRGVGNANPLPNMARIATMGARKLNKLRVACTEKLYEYETEGGTWKDRLHEISRVVGEDGKSVFTPNALLYFMKLYERDEMP